jgi:hypothetical protein
MVILEDLRSYVLGVFLLILTLITIFRKRLSSNDEYRQPLPQPKHPNPYGLEQPRLLLSKYNQLIQNMIFSPHKPDYRASGSGAESCPLNSLSSELLVHLLGYLDTHEIVTASISSTSMRESFTADVVWEQLWRVTYGAHWRQPMIKTIRQGRDIHWDPFENFGPPQTGWYHFYLTFEACWMDWLLAGYATPERCLVGVEGAIFDVTAFMLDHPGSPETLSEGAGCDATEVFHEIGHSVFAEGLKRRLCVWDPAGQYSIHPTNTVYALQDDLHIPGIRMPGTSRLLKHTRLMQRSIAALANEELQPRKHSASQRLAQAAQRITLIAEQKDIPLFGPSRHPVKELGGYYPCAAGEHAGSAKAFYDCLGGDWSVWWTCCGKAHTFLPDAFQSASSPPNAMDSFPCR